MTVSLPLRLLPEETKPERSLCDKVRRKVNARGRRVARYNAAAVAINDLLGETMQDGFYESPLSDSVCPRIMNAVTSDFPSFEADEALKALLGSSAYCPDMGAGSLASFVTDNVSLPTDQVNAAPLSNHLQETATTQINNPHEEMILSPEEYEGEVEHHGIAGSHTDPILKNSKKKYLEFLKLLFKCGLIGFNKSSQVLSEVGIFFVRKKSGELRLILDCRRTNQYFRTPPSGSTTGLGALSGVRVPAGKTLYGSSYDIKDMFYRLRVPDWLQNYLGLPSLAASEVRQHFGDVIPAEWGNDVSVSPTFLVLPMGFSWSFYFAQEVLREAIRVSLPHAQFVVDRSPVGEVGDSCSLAMAYADNGYHFSTPRDMAKNDARTVEQYLNKIGLATHEEAVACSTCIVLGGALDGSGLVLRPKASRIGLLCFVQGSSLSKRGGLSVESKWSTSLVT